MPIHIVLDSSGDSRRTFAPLDPQQVTRAKEHFEDLARRGYQAFDKNGGQRLSQFDATVEETLFVPHLKGG